MSREQLRLRNEISSYDFAIHETELYLDTHPNCRRAIAMLEKYRAGRKRLIGEYERRYGNYVVTSDDVQPKDHWNWVDNPWPWEFKGVDA